jgi:hypothetical protein
MQCCEDAEQAVHARGVAEPAEPADCINGACHVRPVERDQEIA